MSYLEIRNITEQEFFKRILPELESELKVQWKDSMGDEWLVPTWEMYKFARSKVPDYEPFTHYIEAIERYVETGEY